MKKFNDLSSDSRRYSITTERRNITESLSRMNAAYYKFRGIYQSGKRFNAKEWLEIMGDLLDSVV